MMCSLQHRGPATLVVMWPALFPAMALAGAFEGYALESSFELPQANCVFDPLPDGRVIALCGRDLYLEDAAGAGSFTVCGTIPAGIDVPTLWASAFLRVSPAGSAIAVGNGGGSQAPGYDDFQLGILPFPALTGGDWYSVEHFDAEWYDESRLAITARPVPPTSVVTVLDVRTSPADPDNPAVIDNIGGSSGGITFDGDGNLYTANGFQSDGPSGTGLVKVFAHAAWTAALAGGAPLDFESGGLEVVDILSGNSLGFDAEGNMHVGGGDYYAGIDEEDFVAVVRATAVADAVAGLGPVDPSDPTDVRRLDPDEPNDNNFFSAGYNANTRELLIADFGASTVYVYTAPADSVPAVSAWGMIVMVFGVLTVGTLILHRRRTSGLARTVALQEVGL